VITVQRPCVSPLTNRCSAKGLSSHPDKQSVDYYLITTGGTIVVRLPKALQSSALGDPDETR
jgi:hypothetical protein